MILVALAMVLIMGMAALGIDVGLNMKDQRQLQSSADVSALAGAAVAGSGSGGGAQTTAQQYAWRNLVGTYTGVPACSSVAPTTAEPYYTSPTDSTCAATYDGYTVYTTYPYAPQNQTVNGAYPANDVVAVDVVHQDPNTFAAALGFGSTTVKVHAAAVGKTGGQPFPFAIAARYLDIQGSSTVYSFGSVLASQCSDNGVGDYSDNGADGGIHITNGAGLGIGGSYAQGYSGGSSNPIYATAEAVLVADPATNVGNSCGIPDTTDAAYQDSWVTFNDWANPSASAPYYNYAYGFNSGPANCGGLNPSVCQISPVGGTSQTSTGPYGPQPNGWEDPCWTGKNGTVNIGWTSTVATTSGVDNITYYNGSTPTSTPTAPLTCGMEPYWGSLEGSFSQTNLVGFPLYLSPLTIASDMVAMPTPITGTPPECSGGSCTFTGGQMYIFSGASASPTIGNSGSLTCVSTGTSTGPGALFPNNGCVFVFENGASFSISKSHQTVNCSYSVGGSAPCSFDFEEAPLTSPSLFSFTGGASGSFDVLQYTNSDTGKTADFPSIYSTQNSPPVTSITASTGEVVFSQPGNLNLNGTIYVPNGILSINANTAPASGQIIADTIRLQGGANGFAGAAYDQSDVAPAVAASTLIE
jgi:Flp pilus assembly protein TadG